MLSDIEANSLGVYRVKDIQKILQIGQGAIYRLIHSGEFPVIAVGRSYRIPQKDFQDWFHTNHGPIRRSKKSQEVITFPDVERDPSCILSKIRMGELSIDDSKTRKHR